MNRPLVERGTGEREKRKGLSSPFPFPFLAVFFFPKQRACSQANKKNLQIHFEFEYLSFFLPHLELKRYWYVHTLP